MKRNFNATRVLPPKLIDEICKHISGCYLYIPGVKTKRRPSRDQEIVELYFEQGVSADEIARRLYLTPRRVRQITRAWKKQQQAPEPEAGK